MIEAAGFFSTGAAWGTALLAVVAIIGLIFAGLSWLYKRGADERELTLAIKGHTAATDKLGLRIETMGHSFRKLEDKVDDHEVRISVNTQNIATNARDIQRLWPTPYGSPGPQLRAEQS